MRKGNAPFVFSACVVAVLAVVGCSGDDTAVPASGGGAGDSGVGGASATGAVPDGGTSGLDGGQGGRDFGEGGGGTRFTFDALAPRDTSDPNCPPSMPMDSDPCAMATTCAYPGGGCTCQRDGRTDAGRTWHCQEFPQRDGGTMMCNDGTTTGSSCEMQGKFCSTGGQTCGCFGTNSDNRKWLCFP